MAYLAISPCGCCSAVMSTGVDTPKEEAKQVSDWIKDGRTVERMTVEDARERFKADCPHTPKWGRAS